jgi:DNA-binding beta-propeller fold protein YncE
VVNTVERLILARFSAEMLYDANRMFLYFTISCFLALALSLSSPPPPVDRGTLAVVNQAEHTLLLVEPSISRIFAKIPVGVNGHEVAISPDGKLAYVPIYGNSGVGKPGTDGSTIDVIDIGKRELVSSISLGRPLRPHRAEFGPGGLLYVSGELGNAIVIVDPAAQKVVGEIPTGAKETHMFVFSPDGKRAYTSNVGAGSVSILDVADKRLLGVVPVAKTVQRISIAPDGKRIFTQDQNSPRIAVIDVADQQGTGQHLPDFKVNAWIDLPDIAFASEPTPDGKFLLAVSMQKHLLIVIDLATLKVIKTLDLPESPSEILIRRDASVAYISCLSGKIAVVGLQSWQLREPIEMTRGVDGLAWIPLGTDH